MQRRTVVSSDKGIAIAASEFSVHKLLSLLKGDVHVAINRLQLTCKDISKLLGFGKCQEIWYLCIPRQNLASRSPGRQ